LLVGTEKMKRNHLKSACAVAQDYIGDYYYCGIGIDKDKDKVNVWYKKALWIGIKKAMNDFCKIYLPCHIMILFFWTYFYFVGILI
jgi:hypothetical protein